MTSRELQKEAALCHANFVFRAVTYAKEYVIQMTQTMNFTYVKRSVQQICVSSTTASVTESAILAKIALGVLWKWKKSSLLAATCNVYLAEHRSRCTNVRKSVNNLCPADTFVLENAGKYVPLLLVKLSSMRNLTVAMKLKNHALRCRKLVVVAKNHARQFLIVVILVLEIAAIVSKEECTFRAKTTAIDGVYASTSVKSHAQQTVHHALRIVRVNVSIVNAQGLAGNCARLVWNRACGSANTKSARSFVGRFATVIDAMNHALRKFQARFVHLDIHASGCAENHALSCAESVTKIKSPSSSLATRTRKELCLLSCKTVVTYLR